MAPKIRPACRECADPMTLSRKAESGPFFKCKACGKPFARADNKRSDLLLESLLAPASLTKF